MAGPSDGLARLRLDLLGHRGIEIVESDLVPYDPGPGWFPLGPSRVALHPRTLADMLNRVGDAGHLVIVERLIVPAPPEDR